MEDKKPLPAVGKNPNSTPPTDRQHKFIDRSPCLKPAGIKTKWGDSVSESLKTITLEEMAEDYYKENCRKRQLTQKKCLPRSPLIHNDTIQELLNVELKKSRFVAFREKFSEDMYFKKAELGRALPLNSKPKEIDNVNTTFGRPGYVSDPLYEVVLPNKSVEQVNREYYDWHDKYVISHKHYLPAERINRKYDPKNFSDKNVFGVRNNVDYTGKMVKKCMSECDQLVIVTKAQKHYLERTLGRLGKKVHKYKYVVPNDNAFGIPTYLDECNVQALLENIQPCVRKTELIDAIAHLNKVRRRLHDRSDIHVFDIKHKLEKMDYSKTGCLQLNTIFDALRDILIRMDEDKIMTAMKHFNLINDDKDKTQFVNFDAFINLIHIQVPVPKTGPISVMPKMVYNKDTIYRDLCKDIAKRVQGETLIDKPKIDVDEARAKDCIEPDIPTHYGLVPSDFEIIRPKAIMQKIFSRVMSEPADFEDSWERAKRNFKIVKDEMSVNQLRAAMVEIRQEKNPVALRIFA